MPFIAQGKTNLIYLLTIVVIAIIVSGGLLYYYYLWIEELDAKLAEMEVRFLEVKPSEEIQEYLEDQEVIVRGTVTKNQSTDAPFWFEIQTSRGLVRIEYRPGEAGCSFYSQYLARSLELDDEVEVSGKFSQGYIRACDSRRYYIVKLWPEDKGAEWKVYQNEEYGFEAKYPPHYLLFERESEIEISAPPSRCKPVWPDIQEEEREATFYFKKYSGYNIDEILEEKGGIEWGWEEIVFYDKKGYWAAVGAEMATPWSGYLVEISPTEVLQIDTYHWDWEGDCDPPLLIMRARGTLEKFEASIKFLR